MDHLVRMNIRSSLKRSDSREAVRQILDGCIRQMTNGPMPSAEKIAFDAGTTTSSIYRHFAAKNDIYIAAAQYILSKHRARIVELVSHTTVDSRSSADFANGLFQSIATQKHLLINLINSLSESDLSITLDHHRDVMTDQLFKLQEKRFGAELVVERQTRIEVTYNTMEHILLAYLKSPPCPVSQETFFLLFTSCTDLFLINFKQPSEAISPASMASKQQSPAKKSK
jgi:AcrR family transcriptional regulator